MLPWRCTQPLVATALIDIPIGASDIPKLSAREGTDNATAIITLPKALATFPRYNLLNAIRVELERIDPANLDEVEETRTLLVLAGETAQDDFTQKPIGEIDERAMAEERGDFCRYIGGLKNSDLSAIEKLPYRRRADHGRIKGNLVCACVLVGKFQRATGFLLPNAGCPMLSPSRRKPTTRQSHMVGCKASCEIARLSAFGSCENTVRNSRKTWPCSCRITMGLKATGLPATWIGSSTPRMRVLSRLAGHSWAT